ncbi:CotH kinase family protein [Paenibacillus sp. NPDC056579]|uniref:CotH kinase family protein n=1 Tax=unclassified Paenibacillus TaxID=185978 RepID=UPI001EF99290|nr:CotH kinase family protein [Paenibacillus sp. H1-7]ULL15073.1 spore coat protein CotH [Paenibacillus sp. H1-7]
MDIRTMHILIGEKELSELQKNVWSDKFEPAQLVSQDKKEPVKIRIRGGHTREYPKKSYEIVRNGKTYHYNAETDDPSMIRNALSFRFFEIIGVPCPKTRHCLMKINGKSHGLYLEIEGVDRIFFRKRGIGVRSLMYASNDLADFSLLHPDTGRRKASLFQGYTLKIGNEADRTHWKSFILKLNTLKGPRLGRYLKQRLHIDNYLRWLAGAVLTGNYDGFEQNYAIFRHKPSNKYWISPWDYEGTWGRNCYGKKVDSDLVRVTGYNKLTKMLLSFPPIRKRYKKILHDLLNRHFTLKKIEPMVQDMYQSIAPHIYRDTTRKWSSSVFDGEPQIIRDYIIERRNIVAEELKKL